MFVPLTRNGNDQISYSDQAFYDCSPFSIDSESNLTSKQDNLPSLPPLSFPHFPSPPPPPFEDSQIFLEHHHDFLLEFHHQPLPPHDPHPQPFISTEQIQRKKPVKRDRHSKINTARGLRDRRMRLSLEVAKRFFGLQDMLGFDKASKTVDWLLNQAKVEINQLATQKNNQSASSTSDCEEGVSSLDEVVISGNQEQQEMVPEVVKRRKTKHSRKSAFPLAKECRERARERARERTKEKIRTRGLVDESKQCREGSDHINQLASWDTFQAAEKCSTQNHSVNPSLDEAKVGSYNSKEHLETLDTIPQDDSFTIFTKWEPCPSMIFNSLNNSGLLLQEHQFAEFQSLGKPWEA
ncbi:hypothetical protein VNO77_21716 [Canavalia gladiata]|uniref:Uncharacterized protein n=1 Tax=Canavalia gladiata TaxID=3824 RepID=A0AAN9QA55_CANGL